MDKNGNAHASWTDFRGNPGHTPANQDVLIANFTRRICDCGAGPSPAPHRSYFAASCT